MKKILSMLLVLSLVLGLAVPAMAADFGMEADKKVIEAGESVTVTIALDEAIPASAGATALQGIVSFDTDLLTYTTHKLGENFSTYTAAYNAKKETFLFSYLSLTNAAFDIPAGTLVAIEFTANEAITADHVKTAVELDFGVKNAQGVDIAGINYTESVSIIVCTEHTWDEGVVTVAPTCKDAGEKKYTCTFEGCGATKTETVEATNDHTAGEAVVENKTGATCTGEGSYDSVVYCTVCGKELSRETIKTDAIGHTEGEAVIENEVAATCTADGSYDTVIYCTVCDAELSRETTVVPATGHTEGEAVIENEVAATCTADGSYDTVVYCTVCNEELSRETTTTPALGHDIVTDKGYEPTCTEDGLTDGEHCTRCDDATVKQEVIKALGHVDEDGDHICDTCNGTASSCVDNDGDGKCDTCGKVTECVDADKDHYCDTCGEKVSCCYDWNRDHKCDYCGDRMSICYDFNCNHKCDWCGKVISKCADLNKDHFCDKCDDKLTDCKDENKDDKCDICGASLIDVFRIGGANRAETAQKIADELKALQGVEKFDTIILAAGYNFPDTLTGAYLANANNAPILLDTAYAAESNLAYIQKNLAADGVVYILGGTAAVPASVEADLVAAGIKVERLAGETRYETNIEILKEAGLKGGATVLVCTGNEAADSLAASATGMPILIVNNVKGELAATQEAYLKSLGAKCEFIIIGGEQAVAPAIAAELAAFDADGKIERIYGATRFETSVEVAKAFFGEATQAVLARGFEYADGLCGGTLAYALKAPVILCENNNTAAAAAYAAEQGINAGYVLGGTAALTDAPVRVIFGMGENEIVLAK